jgi:hypothetical protein
MTVESTRYITDYFFLLIFIISFIFYEYFAHAARLSSFLIDVYLSIPRLALSRPLPQLRFVLGHEVIPAWDW